MFSCGVYEIFRNLRTTASEVCCFTWSVLVNKLHFGSIDTWFLHHNLLFRLPILPSLLMLLILGRLLLRKYLSIFKNNVTHIFRLSIFSAQFEDWEQKWAQYFKPLAWSLFSTQSNICDGVFFSGKKSTVDTAIIRSSRLVVFCKKGVLKNFAKFTGKHLR